MHRRQRSPSPWPSWSDLRYPALEFGPWSCWLRPKSPRPMAVSTARSSPETVSRPNLLRNATEVLFHSMALGNPNEAAGVLCPACERVTPSSPAGAATMPQHPNQPRKLLTLLTPQRRRTDQSARAAAVAICRPLRNDQMKMLFVGGYLQRTNCHLSFRRLFYPQCNLLAVFHPLQITAKMGPLSLIIRRTVRPFVSV